jgi:hypothetical protein
MIRYFSIILLLALSSGLFAQNKAIMPARSLSLKPDTIKKPRILKEYCLSADYSEEVSTPVDTIFSLFNRFKIADKYSPVNASLGNYGLPFYQISFFDRITDPDRFLYTYYYPFMHLPSNAIFMNTQVPYTELNWSFAGPRETSEQTFRIKHSQNVNRFFNFGLIFDIIYSLGQYNYQRSEDKDFTFFSSYTGTKYKLYLSAGINNINSYENGGILDETQLNQSSTLEIPVKLGGADKALSTLKNRNLLLVQRFTISGNPVIKSDSTSHKRSGFFGLSGTFSHIFVIESNKRRYKDSYPLSLFYDTAKINISKTITNDTLFTRSIKNTIRFDFATDETRKFSLGGGVGLRNEIFRFSQKVPTHILPLNDTTSSEMAVWHRGNNVLVGSLYNRIGDKFRWIATGELYVTGYRAGDFNLNGEISKSFDFKKGRASWLINGSMLNRQPSFWYEQWGSNNFEWHNNFNKEFRIDIGSSFSYPARKFDIKFNYAIIKNYTDFDTAALPSQYSGGLSVAAISVRKEFRAWKFHLATDAIIQKSSNVNVLDLPLATVRSAGYFEHLFRFKKTGGKLNFQLGVDVTYNTLYHSYSYMPATGRFYRQDKVSAGDYPYMNVFLNFKVKRTRVFVMFDHVNYGLMGGSLPSNYDMVPNYPMNIRMLRYGLSWTFYN